MEDSKFKLFFSLMHSAVWGVSMIANVDGTGDQHVVVSYMQQEITSTLVTYTENRITVEFITWANFFCTIMSCIDL